MKNKWITGFVFLFLVLLSQNVFSQIVGVGYSSKLLTEYTDGTPNDTIYVWNDSRLGKQNAKLKIVPKSGVAPYTFDWFYHDESTFSWKRFSVDKGSFSVIENLPSDGYRVQVKDVNGLLVECYTTWVWNLNVESNVNVDVVNCSDIRLGAQVDAESNFVYYNLPPPESIITPNTKIKVEFSAKHTYISDLAFYLVGPPSCGSPRILLSPHPGSINPNRHICNSGDNVNNLTFSNTSTGVLDICSSPAPLSGNYGSYSLDGKSYEINWSPLMGCNAAQGGWSVQIYDCIYLDVGYLESATITFSDLESVCGSPTSISYSSGQIRSSIRDMSCTAQTASIFQVYPHSNLRNPIVIDADIEVEWLKNNVKITNDLDYTISNISEGDYTFDFKTYVRVKNQIVQQNVFSKLLQINSLPPIAEDQFFCKNVLPKISDLIATGSNIRWYLNETDDDELNINTILRSGFYYVSQELNGCESNRKKIQVTLLETEAPLASDQVFCTSQITVSDLVATGSNLKWYLFASGGEPLTLDANVNEGLYYVSQTINGCESIARTPVKVFIQKTEKPLLSTVNFCFNTQAKISDLQVFGSNIKFYKDEVGGILLDADTFLTTGTYYVSQTINGCESDRELIQVTIFPVFDLSPFENQVICSGTDLVIQLPSSDEFVTYQWEVMSNNVLGAVKGSGTIIKQKLATETDEDGIVIYQITPIANGCVGNMVELNVLVTPIPKVNIEVENNILCSGDYTQIKLTSSNKNTNFRWSAISKNVQGATNGIGNIISQQLITAESNASVIYKVIPYIDDCEGEPVEIEVLVKKLPELKLEDGFLCYDVITGKVITPYVIDTKLSSLDYTFEWFYEGNLMPNEKSPFYSTLNKGKYTVNVTNNYGCLISEDIHIYENKSVESATYALSNYFKDAQRITVTVHGTGDYLYQLDDGPLQESNVFNHVLPGVHKVVITDRNDCTYIVFDEIITVHYPNFFTPNGDGVNDKWNIWSLRDKGQAEIFIFDRFGKLIRQISPQGEGWDGTINGAYLPETDYWFIVNYYENGVPRTFKSHFALKR